MNEIKIELKNIGKKFGRRIIFENVDFTFASGKACGIAGENGSGKSTLLKIIANVLSPAKGSVGYTKNGKIYKSEKIHNNLGFVAPYLVLYSEFTPLENLFHISKIRGISYDKQRAEELLTLFNLYKRRNDYLRGFSSGMLQRMKFVFALYHNPDFLLLDEPTSNLDDEGKETVYKTIGELAREKLVIVASNEKNDLALCDKILEIKNYKRKK